MLVLNTLEPQRIEAGTTLALLQPVSEVEPARQPGTKTGGAETPGREAAGRPCPPQPNRPAKEQVSRPPG